MPFGSIARKESTSVSASGFGPAPCARVSAGGPAKQKLTTRPPLPLRMSRRETCMFMAASPSCIRRANDRFDNAGMRSAPTQIIGERVLHLRFSRFPGRSKECSRLHDHPVDAVAALRRLLLDEGILHGMELARAAEPFQRDHLLLGGDCGQRRSA